MTATRPDLLDELYERSAASFDDWELIKEIIDESIDLALNYRQSGHPGGSRSKVHMFVSLLLSGAMRWDIRRPWRPFGDRFVLGAGHTVPLVYATLAVLNEAMRARAERDADPAFALPDDGRWALTWEDLLKLRRRGGLPGHAEMEGKTLFLKFNTGPSGHGMPPAAGEAVALKLAGAEEVKVFAVEGEGGLTPGATHETRNTAWGLGLSNLVFLVDWNDFGIDDPSISSVVHGTPASWFEPYGWRVVGTQEGSEWAPVTRAVLEAARGDNPDGVPSMAWFKTRKGRGYGKYDYKSHGTPHTMNSPEFWAVRKEFMARHGVDYAGVDEPAPTDAGGARRAGAPQLRRGHGRAARGERRGRSDQRPAGRGRRHGAGSGRGAQPRRTRRGDLQRPALHRRQGLPGGHVEAARREGARTAPRWRRGAPGSTPPPAPSTTGRCSSPARADLAESTNIAGFAKDWEDLPGWGWYNRDTNLRGALAPAGDHRVHQRGRQRGNRHRQPGG